MTHKQRIYLSGCQIWNKEYKNLKIDFKCTNKVMIRLCRNKSQILIHFKVDVIMNLNIQENKIQSMMVNTVSFNKILITLKM